MIDTFIIMYMFGMASMLGVGSFIANDINKEYISGLLLAATLWPFVFAKAILPV